MSEASIPITTTDNPMDAEWLRDRLALEDVDSTVEPEAGTDKYHLCVAQVDHDRAKAILEADETMSFSDDSTSRSDTADPPSDDAIETDDDHARDRLARWIGTYSPVFLICFPLAPFGLWYLIRLHRMPGTLGMSGRAELPLAWFFNTAGTFFLLAILYLVFRQ
jgi:hypothetical protein